MAACTLGGVVVVWGWKEACVCGCMAVRMCTCVVCAPPPPTQRCVQSVQLQHAARNTWGVISWGYKGHRVGGG